MRLVKSPFQLLLISLACVPSFFAGNSVCAQDSAPKSNFAPHPTLPGSEINRHDPVAIYKEAGIDKQQESRIRQMAREFEDMQAVRLKRLSNLSLQLKAISLETDPDEKDAMAKQDEINKALNEMANARLKLLLDIRQVLDHDQKERLVQLLRSRPSGTKDIK